MKKYIPLLGFSIFTGATFPLAKYTVAYFSPSSAAAWRFGIAAVAMFIILGMTEGFKKEAWKKNFLLFFLLGIVGIFGFNTLFFVGLKYTSPVNGALVMATNPLLTTILARFILKESMTTRQISGIILALAGVTLVITQGSVAAISHLTFSIGDLIILAGNLCWALYGVIGRRYIKESTPLATTTYSIGFGALSLVVLSLFGTNPVSVSSIPIKAWGAIVFMALFTSVLGYLWWNKGMKELGANKTALFFNLVPVVTMVISFLTGASITWIQLIGAAFVLSGVLTATGMLRIPFFKTLNQKVPL